MNIISYDKYTQDYRFYTGVNCVVPNIGGYPGSVKFLAISRYSQTGDYISAVRIYKYMPDSLFQIKEWVSDTRQKIRDNEHRLSNFEME